MLTLWIMPTNDSLNANPLDNDDPANISWKEHPLSRVLTSKCRKQLPNVYIDMQDVTFLQCTRMRLPDYQICSHVLGLPNPRKIGSFFLEMISKLLIQLLNIPTVLETSTLAMLQTMLLYQLISIRTHLNRIEAYMVNKFLIFSQR